MEDKPGWGFAHARDKSDCAFRTWSKILFLLARPIYKWLNNGELQWSVWIKSYDRCRVRLENIKANWNPIKYDKQKLTVMQKLLSAYLSNSHVNSLPHSTLHNENTPKYNFDPLKPHFYIVKLGFTGVYIIFLNPPQNIDCGSTLESPRRGCSN